MLVEETFIWGKNERKTGDDYYSQSPSVANQNAEFALVH